MRLSYVWQFFAVFKHRLLHRSFYGQGLVVTGEPTCEDGIDNRFSILTSGESLLQRLVPLNPKHMKIYSSKHKDIPKLIIFLSAITFLLFRSSRRSIVHSKTLITRKWHQFRLSTALCRKVMAKNVKVAFCTTKWNWLLHKMV